MPKSAGEETIPDDYIRKQTLVSNERYFTQELKELETTLLTARDRINDLEYRYFCELRDAVAAEVEGGVEVGSLLVHLVVNGGIRSG